jgi:hypothetical protein
MSRVLVLASAVALMLAPAAMADKTGDGYLLTSLDGSVTANGGTFVVERDVTAIDISGVDSMDGFGDPDNVIMNIALAPDALVTGIGWDTEQYADSPSWLSEMRIEITDSAIIGGVGITPGAGVNSSGWGTFSSGGILDLVDLGLDFYVGPDGVLRLEFWETYVDYVDDWDGYYETGTLTVQWIPEPASLALVALGALALLRRR